MKKILTAAFVLIIFISLSGCLTTVAKKSIRGEHRNVAASAGTAGGLEQLSMKDHQLVCESLLKLREFKNFFACHAVLTQRLETYSRNLHITHRNSFDSHEFLRAKVTIELEAMLSDAYMALGQYDDVIEHAGTAVRTLDQFIATLGNCGSANGFSLGCMFSVNPAYSSYLHMYSIIPMRNLALAHIIKGHPELAEPYANKIKNIDTSNTIPEIRKHDAERRGSTARIYFALKNYPQALDALNKSISFNFIEIIIENTWAINPLNYILAPLAFGTTSIEDVNYITEFELRFISYRCLLETGKLQEAKSGYEEALAEPKLSGFGQMHYLVLYDRGRVSLLENNADEAITYFKRAIEVIESQRSSITLERFKIGFAGDKQDIYSIIVETLAKLDRPSEALEFAERGKARALVDLLATQKDFRSNKQSARSRELLNELEKFEQKGSPSTSKVKGGKLRSASTMINEIKAADAELASLISVSTLSAKAIQSKLKSDEALLEYFYQGDSDLFAFVVTKENVKVFILPAKGLVEQVKDFRSAISRYSDNSWEQGSAALYTRLILPLSTMIENKKHLTIVPHGVLHYLPFNALREGHFLIEEHTLRLLPSASVLQFLDKKTYPVNNLLVLGNPDLNNLNMALPGAELEAKAIAKNWSKVRVVLRKKASETLFKRSSGKYRYLHLATHGEFNPEMPQLSRMLLSADESNDGNLTLAEVYSLRLNAEMVTLSACQTGLGDVKNGDDVVGLNRGFLYAGANSIVASLWSVPDEPTRVLMTSFYKNLRKMDKRKALQQAQLLGIKKYRHPISWAAFQMTGGI